MFANDSNLSEAMARLMGGRQGPGGATISSHELNDHAVQALAIEGLAVGIESPRQNTCGLDLADAQLPKPSTR